MGREYDRCLPDVTGKHICSAILLHRDTVLLTSNHHMQLADDDVCSGTFNRTGRIISHDLRQISLNGTTAVKLCDAVFGLCQVGF